jgi:hypothetical protein
LPAGYLATTGLTILASQHNPPLEDIEAALTARLMRSGVAPMTGVLKITDGTAGAPGLAFNTAATFGLYKTTSGIGVAVSGALASEFLSTGMELSGLGIIAATQLTAPAANDTLPIYDLSATANRRILLSDFFKVINDLTADASPSSANDYLVTYDASATAAKKVLLQNLPLILPRGYIDGCTLANGADTTNDITIAAGVCRDSTNAVNITVAAMTTGKQLDANWAPGDAAGMRNSAVGIANTTYHIYAVAKADGTQDIYAHTSTTVATVLTALQAESGGSSYVYARLIGSIVRVGATLLQFDQTGDKCLLKTYVADINNTADHTTAVTAALASVPTGIKMDALVTVGAAGSGAAQGTLVTPTAVTDQAPSDAGLPGLTVTSTASVGQYLFMQVAIQVDTSAQVRYRSTNAAVDTLIITRGWIHPRGKDA